MENTAKSNVIWAYICQIFYSGINIIILPFIVGKLTPNELGLWYTFTAVGAIASLLDFGFLTTITRNLTYAWSGAQVLTKEGIDYTDVKEDEPNIQLFSNVIQASKWIYGIISIAILIIFGIFGTVYIHEVADGSVKPEVYYTSWIVYVIGVMLNVYYSYWTPVLRSVQEIKRSYQVLAISKVVQLVVSIAGVLLGCGLLSVAAAFLLSHLVNRILSRVFFYKSEKVKPYIKALKSSKTTVKKVKEVFTIIWPNAYKQGLVALSKFLTGQAGTLLCSAFWGLGMSSMYGLSLQVFGIITTCANIMLTVFTPEMGKLYVNNDRKKLYNRFTLVIGVQGIVVLCGGLAATFLGKDLLELIKSQSTLLPMATLFVLLAYEFIMNSFEATSSFIALSNKIPMFKARIISSIATVLLQFIMCFFFSELGALALIVPALAVLLCYNGWRWMVYVADDFNTSVFRIFKDSIINSYRFVIGRGKTK